MNLIPIVAIAATAWVIVVLARLRHGRVRRRQRAGRASPTRRRMPGSPTRTRRLRLTVRRLEERMAVLERIATDPAERTAREIEQLR